MQKRQIKELKSPRIFYSLPKKTAEINIIDLSHAATKLRNWLAFNLFMICSWVIRIQISIWSSCGSERLQPSSWSLYRMLSYISYTSKICKHYGFCILFGMQQGVEISFLFVSKSKGLVCFICPSKFKYFWAIANLSFTKFGIARVLSKQIFLL